MIRTVCICNAAAEFSQERSGLEILNIATMLGGKGKSRKGDSTTNSLERRIEDLQDELRKTKAELARIQEKEAAQKDVDTINRTVSKEVAHDKKGYLFKWQDNVIGWGGTKWSLLFVSLEAGRISCFESHMDEKPLYSLTLRGCAVQDEGSKRNKRYKSKVSQPSIEEPGAYFHVFSIYHMPDSADERQQENFETNLPLLRFSTTSLAEKNLWMEIISETCAYCETDQFMLDEANRAAEKERQKEQQMAMAMAMPGVKKGTLPPLYFAPSVPGFQKFQRRPSRSSMAKSNIYRTQSQSKLDGDFDKVEAKYPPSKPMHVEAAPSYLSAEAPVQNYRGLFNLAMILLIVSNFRLIVDTLRKHGFALWHLRSYLEHLRNHYYEDPWREFPFVSGFLLLQAFIVTCFSIEWMLSRKILLESVGMSLHILNMHSTLIVSIWIVWYHIETPYVGAVLLLNGTITWMKLISYVLANEDYRLAAKSGKEDSLHASIALLTNLEPQDMEMTYPENITLGNIYYFWLAPTLTYQMCFPKVARVRLRRVVGILCGLSACFALFVLLIAQFVAPVLDNLVLDLEKTHGVYTPGIFAEYWLKLAIANTYLWLLMFYFYFHLYLNLWAEILRFGDRVFYKDWWNSSELASYWRLWNQPVHLWLVRHVYFPCIRLKLSKTVAMFLVFFLSAVLHEVLISVPFHMIRPWSFLGIMMQIPLVAFTKWLYRRSPGSSIGNIIFWLSFCVIGQPMAILMYTADYKYGKHNAQVLMTSHI